jgi:hypothetical protein
MKMKSSFFGRTARVALAVLVAGAMFTGCYKDNGGGLEPITPPTPAQPVPAQYIVSGTVTDALTGGALEGVSVTVGAVTKTTNQYGTYSADLGTTYVASVTVTFKKTGYVDVVREVNISKVSDGEIGVTQVNAALTVPPTEPADAVYLVTGTVTDAISGNPIENVSVAVTGVTGSVPTNANGLYSTEFPYASPITIVFTKEGYYEVKREVVIATVAKGQTGVTRVDVSLRVDGVGQPDPVPPIYDPATPPTADLPTKAEATADAQKDATDNKDKAENAAQVDPFVADGITLDPSEVDATMPDADGNILVTVPYTPENPKTVAVATKTTITLLAPTGFSVDETSIQFSDTKPATRLEAGNLTDEQKADLIKRFKEAVSQAYGTTDALTLFGPEMNFEIEIPAGAALVRIKLVATQNFQAHYYLFDGIFVTGIGAHFTRYTVVPEFVYDSHDSHDSHNQHGGGNGAGGGAGGSGSGN